MELPTDLDAALTAAPRARAVFERLTSQNRFGVLYRIESAKRDDTRASRIETFVAMLERGETIDPQKRALVRLPVPVRPCLPDGCAEGAGEEREHFTSAGWNQRVMMTFRALVSAARLKVS
jgi:hypothetical protein